MTMHRLTFCLLVLCGLWAAAAHSQTYTFTTLAGKAGSSGSADGPASDARFSQPLGVAVDNYGGVYVTDSYNNTIRKIWPNGIVNTLAGHAGSIGYYDGPSNTASFYRPSGIAVDRGFNVYVTANYSTIRKITPDGMVSTIAGKANSFGSADGPGALARFYWLNGLAVDSAGNLYVADAGNNNIRKITPAGVVSTLAGLAGVSGSADGPGNLARFANPAGVAVDSAGNVYVTDAHNYSIRKITPDGVVSTVAGLAGVSGYVDGTGSQARFGIIDSITVDTAGHLYVADWDNSTIRKITPSGVVSTVAGLAGVTGSADGTGGMARFNGPVAIAVNSKGNLHVADYRNNTIRLGQLASVATPTLCFSGAGNRLVLSWPLAACNYVVETSSILSPAAVWTSISSPVGAAGDSFVLTNTLDAGARFYRLRAP